MLDFLAVYGKQKKEIDGRIISHLTQKPIEQATFAYQNANYILSQNRDRLFLFLTDSKPQKILVRTGGGGENRISFFDGNVTQKEFLTDIRKLEPFIETSQKDHSEIFGFYCYGDVSTSGTNHIHRDVLGNYPLFISFNSNLTAVSNNPYLAAQAIYGADWRKHKNIYALANVVMSGEIADNEMTFKGVYFVPQNAGISVDEGNNVSFYSLVEKMFYPMSDEEWNGRLEREHKKMVSFLKSYAGGENVGGNITGGFDSRVMLALSIEAGISKNVSYTVIGYEDHPDVIIANQIAKHFGLNLTRQDVAISDLDNKKVEDSFKKTLTEYSNSAGILSLNDCWQRQIPHRSQSSKKPKNVKNMLMGSASEYFRGYHSLHLFDRGIPNKSIGKEEQKELLSLSAASAVQQPEMLTQKAKDYLTKTFSRAISSFDNLYAIDLLLDRTRLPQFHAGLNRKNNNCFCSIGYNSWLHRLSMIQAPPKRVSADIPFRLIENSTPELLYFPFDSKSWKYLAFAHRPDAARFLQIKPVKNIANRPMPSRVNLVKQTRFLIENNVPLDSSIFEVFDETWLKATIDRAKLTIARKAPEDRSGLRLLIDIYGTSLFMQSKEGNLSAGCPAPVPLSAQSFILPIKPLYTFNKSWYSEPAEQVLKNGEICFEKQKVFRQSDHNTLNDFEKFIFELDLEHGRLEGELSKANASLRWERNAKKSITAKFDALSQKTTSSTWLFKQWLNHNKTKLAKSLHLTQK